VERLGGFDDERGLLLPTVARAVTPREKQRAIGADHLVQLGPGLREHERLRGAVKVLERQARVLRARFFRNLTLDHRHYRSYPHLLFAPLAQGGGGSRPEKLHLEAVSRERVPGNEEAEHGLFAP